MGIKVWAITIVTTASMACCLATSVRAQEPVPPPPPLPAAMEPVGQAQPKLDSQPEPQSPPAPRSQPNAPIQPDSEGKSKISFAKSLALQLMNEELARLQAAKANQLDDLTSAVENLQTVLKARRQAAAQAPRPTPPHASQPADAKPLPAVRTTPDLPTTVPPVVTDSPQEPALQTPSDNAPPLAQNNSEPSDPLFPPAETSTVDAIALADNLFAAGDVEGAMRKYQMLTKKRLPVSHKRWVIYQVACCHRRLGNIPAAEVIYRELASVTDKTTVPTQARWWLDALQRRKEAEERLDRVRFTIASMEQEQRDEPSP